MSTLRRSYFRALPADNCGARVNPNSNAALDPGECTDTVRDRRDWRGMERGRWCDAHAAQAEAPRP